jgi:phosphoribosyl 1,2-cyclic phosphodiesterase
LQVQLAGVRGSLPAPGIDFVRYGGHTSCVALSHDGAPAPTLILDAGTGLEIVTESLAGRPFGGTILLSHLHWDHTYGLPFFSSGDRPDAHVAVVLPEQESGIEASAVLAREMSPPYFPIEPTQLRGEWSFATIAPGEREIEGFTVLAREIPHKGGRTFGYRVSDGHSAIAYLPDHNPTGLGAGEDGFGEYHPAALALARDADVLVHDAQLLPDELAAEGEFGHAVADYAVELAKRAGTRSVQLFHHRHDRTDDQLDALAARLGGASPPAVSVAAQGVVLSL